jgi:hypothetical protein
VKIGIMLALDHMMKTGRLPAVKSRESFGSS